MDKNNLLTMYPVVADQVITEEENGQIRLIVRHTGFFRRLAVKLFRTSDQTTTTLDAHGSFVWRHCDGRFTVGEIVGVMRERFGSDAEPALERLILFLRMLIRLRLIRLCQTGNREGMAS